MHHEKMNNDKKNSIISTRYGWITAILGAVFFLILGKAFVTMTVDRERWMRMSKMQTKQDRPLLPKRGNILACDGEILASSLPQYQLYADFKSVEDDSAMRAKDQHRRDTLLRNNINDICNRLHKIFPDIDPAKMKKHLLEGCRKRSQYWPIYTKEVSSLPLKRKENRRITYVDYSKVKTIPFFNSPSCMNYVKVPMRERPFGELARRTIGDFRDSARNGLELTFNSVLTGKEGKFHYEKVLNRKVQRIDVPAEDGCDVVTTLDVNMQEICEKALSDKLSELEAISGVCVLMEVKTGDIKAMTSLQRREDGTYHEDSPTAVTDLYEPGSVFKPMSFLVAFDDGYLHLDDEVNINGGIHLFGKAKMKDHNWESGGYGVLKVPKIIANSSNVGVSVLIDRFYHNNPEKFVEGLDRIGVREDLKIPIPGYKKPRIKKPSERPQTWSGTTLPWMSIGYETQNVPINTLNFYNGIANGGKMLRPRLVKAIMRGSEVVKEYPVEVIRQKMASDHAINDLKVCLEEVTISGAGKPAASRLFHSAGKTGTAQVWGAHGKTGEFFVTFVGYFPSDRPLYSCIVCIKKRSPAFGGLMCGPVFKRVSESIMAMHQVTDFKQAADTSHTHSPLVCSGNLTAAAKVMAQLNIAYKAGFNADTQTPLWGRSFTEDGTVSLVPSAMPDNEVPDLKGYGLRDAIFRMESMGMKVSASGVGTVTGQSVPVGTKVKRGMGIHLTLGHQSAVREKKTEIKREEQGKDSDNDDDKPREASTKPEPAAAVKREKPKAEAESRIKSGERKNKSRDNFKKSREKSDKSREKSGSTKKRSSSHKEASSKSKQKKKEASTKKKAKAKSKKERE